MKKCPNCGRIADSKFCPDCGAEMPAEENTSGSSVTDRFKKRPKHTSDSENGRKMDANGSTYVFAEDIDETASADGQSSAGSYGSYTTGASAAMGASYTAAVRKPVYKKWWFWLIIALVALCLVAALLFAGSRTSTSSDTDTQYITFKELSMEIPSTWIYDEDVSSSSIAYYKEYDGAETDENLTGMLYIMKHHAGGYVDPETDFDIFLQGLASTDGIHDMENPSAITDINGYDAQSVRYEQDISGKTYYVRTYIIAVEDSIFSLAYVDTNTGMAAFENAIDTITFSDTHTI